MDLPTCRLCGNEGMVDVELDTGDPITPYVVIQQSCPRNCGH